MRQFAYQGDHAEVTLYGVTFQRGEPVPVADAFLVAKLAGNSHFSETLSGGAELLPAEAPKRRGRKPKEA